MSAIEDESLLREKMLREVAQKLPGPVRFRIENAFEGLERSRTLLSIDQEMSSFRAITAEEEAATALIQAVRIREYPGWRKLNSRMHTHKTAVRLSIEAIERGFSRNHRNLLIEIDKEKPRIDVGILFSDLGIKNPPGENLMMQIVEPLEVVRTRKDANGKEVPDYFDRELAEIAAEASADSPAQLVKRLANDRNRLLYASDSSLPSSQFTLESHATRRRTVRLLTGLCVMVLQTERHQALVKHAMRAVLALVGRLPSDEQAVEP